MSDALRKFLQAWIDWVDAGAPQDKPFHRGYGLCTNSCTFTNSACYLENEMRSMWAKEGRCLSFPFCSAEYDKAQYDNTMHRDGERVAWVRKQLKSA